MLYMRAFGNRDYRCGVLEDSIFITEVRICYSGTTRRQEMTKIKD